MPPPAQAGTYRGIDVALRVSRTEHRQHAGLVQVGQGS